MNKYINPNNNINVDNVNPKYITLPYIKEFSPKIRYILKQFNYIVRYSSGLKLKNILYNKLSKKENNYIISGVYLIKCITCNCIYIGQSKCILNRINQHKGKQSSVYEHLKNNKTHKIDYKNIQILHKERFYSKRKFLESWEINKYKLNGYKLMNKKEGNFNNSKTIF